MFEANKKHNQFKVPKADRNSVSDKKLGCKNIDELLSGLTDDQCYEDVDELPYENVDKHQRYGKDDQSPYYDVPDQDYCDKNDYSKRAKDLQAAFGRKYVPIDCGWGTFYIDEQRLDEADEIIRAAKEAYMRMLSEMMDNGRK